WVLDTPGTGTGPWPQFESRVVPGQYHLFGQCPAPGTAPQDAPAVFRGGKWFLRASLSNGTGDSCFFFGQPGDIPVTGDWDGNGTRTVGIFRPSEGKWYVTDHNGTGVAEHVYQFGQPGDLPVAGDWNGDGKWTLGIFRPSEGRWYLTDDNNSGVAQRTLQYGQPGDLPVSGDWDKDGKFTVGVFRPST